MVFLVLVALVFNISYNTSKPCDSSCFRDKIKSQPSGTGTWDNGRNRTDGFKEQSIRKYNRAQ